MMNAAINEWLAELPARAGQYSIVFLQLGNACQLAKTGVQNLPGVRIDARSFVDGSPLLLRGIVFVEDLEILAKDRGNRLGQLRERVMREAADGRSVVMLSTWPKTAYPDTIGSDVIADAKQVFAPSDFDVVDMPSEISYDFHATCVRELGDRTLSSLAEVLWEFQLAGSEALERISKPDVEALRGAGLVQADNSAIAWKVPGSMKDFRHAVAHVASETVSAGPSVPDTFKELWMLERLIRNAVRGALRVKLGAAWRENCLTTGLREEVVERARRDTQPGAKNIRDLRDPLEWLSTSELLSLRESRSLGGLGLEPYLWSKLGAEILPIRNKVAHMRVVSEEDSRKAQMWRRLIEQRVFRPTAS